ncbi:hypothetical protein HYV86_01550 [Candidatus Woesearchaeota archaeon]|nr:hypothetical protein [Candidatus Woesearchaeota archaeon]
MDKFTWGMIGILIISVIGMTIYFGGGSITGSTVKDVTVENVKIVEVGLTKSGAYTDLTLNLNEPVVLTNDGTLRGCSTFIVQKDLGLRADISSKGHPFTPTKTGTFTYTCSMGMYLGTMTIN